MKTLRYLLSVVAIMGVLGVSAQTLAQNPEIQMHSTSGMVYSGSNLPMAAESGAYVTGNTPGTYVPVNGGSLHVKRNGLGGGGGSGEPGDRPEPYEDPIGDAMWPMMMLALAYAIYKVSRMRRREEGC